MLRAMDGHGYCDFARAFFKYPNRGFWGAGPNTLTGSIQPGPFASTFALRTQVANPLYYWQLQTAGTTNVWNLGVWLRPLSLTATRSIALLQDNSTPPNLITTGVIQVAPDGTVIVASGAGANVFVFPASFDAPKLTTFFVASRNKLPFGAWSHIAVRFTIPPGASGGFGTIELWVNGSLDSTATNVAFGCVPAGGANILTGCWTSAGGDVLDRSQIIAFDGAGSANNTAVSPRAQILGGYFPASDVANGNWVSSVGGANALALNENPGPDSDGGYITIPGLSSPDQLFALGVPGGNSNILGIGVSLAAKTTLPASVQALARQAATTRLLGSPLALPTAAYATLQSVSELNPATGSQWTDADLAAAAFGFRGLSGTGEHVSQFFLEKLIISGLGSYGY